MTSPFVPRTVEEAATQLASTLEKSALSDTQRLALTRAALGAGLGGLSGMVVGHRGRRRGGDPLRAGLRGAAIGAGLGAASPYVLPAVRGLYETAATEPETNSDAGLAAQREISYQRGRSAIQDPGSLVNAGVKKVTKLVGGAPGDTEAFLQGVRDGGLEVVLDDNHALGLSPAGGAALGVASTIPSAFGDRYRTRLDTFTRGYNQLKDKDISPGTYQLNEKLRGGRWRPKWVKGMEVGLHDAAEQARIHKLDAAVARAREAFAQATPANQATLKTELQRAQEQRKALGHSIRHTMGLAGDPPAPPVGAKVHGPGRTFLGRAGRRGLVGAFVPTLLDLGLRGIESAGVGGAERLGWNVDYAPDWEGPR